MKEESIHKPTPIEIIEQFKRLFSDNPIDWANYEQLAEDCWLFLTNDKLPEKATIKKKLFLHEVKIMIESAVMFAGRSKPIESEKAKDERIKELEKQLSVAKNGISKAMNYGYNVDCYLCGMKDKAPQETKQLLNKK